MAYLEAALLRLRIALRSTAFGAAAGVMALFSLIMLVAALCVAVGLRYGPVIGLLSGGGVFLLLALLLLFLARPPRRAVAPARGKEDARAAPPPSSAPPAGLEAMAAGLVGEEIARRPYGVFAAAVAAGALIGLSRRSAKRRPPR